MFSFHCCDFGKGSLERMEISAHYESFIAQVSGYVPALSFYFRVGGRR